MNDSRGDGSFDTGLSGERDAKETIAVTDDYFLEVGTDSEDRELFNQVCARHPGVIVTG